MTQRCNIVNRCPAAASLVAVVILCVAAGDAAAPPAAKDAPPANPLATAWDSLPSGRWREARRSDAVAEGLTEEQRQEIARLESIGYLSGSHSAPPLVGVTVYDPARAFRGHNSYTSGHLQGALLMDMRGEVVHRWECEFDEVWPDYVRTEPGVGETPGDWTPWTNTGCWRRAHLCENGDVLGIYEGLGIVRLDRTSEVVWANLAGCHHDLDVTDNGTVYVLTRDAHILPRHNKRWPVLEDYVSVLDGRTGREFRRVSVLEAFERSMFASFLERMQKRGDILHTNTVEVLDRRLAHRNPAFREGNVLISLRKLDVIAVIDMDRARVVWAMSGMWNEQHEPTVLANGRMLIFDNRGWRSEEGEEASRVLEFDPFTQELLWSYGGQGAEFYSKTCGTAARLPNGNTLITESDYGRAFEVTDEGEIVWEFMNLAVTGSRDEFIATLFEVVRVSRGQVAEWLETE